MIEEPTASDQSSVPTPASGPASTRAIEAATPGPPTAAGDRLAGWCLLTIIIGASATLGWFAGRQGTDGELVLIQASFAANGGEPELAAALDAGDSRRAPQSSDAEIGRLKGEMLRLRVLFQRLAEAAELDDDGEFDVDYEIDALTGSGEPLSALDPADPDALSLLIERFDPMLEQSERMDTIFRERRQEFDRRLSGRPLDGGRISSGFGHRVDPLTGQRVVHRGLDFVGEVGDPILALADGVVTFSGPNGGYGLLVEIEHAGGFKTRYAHNDSNIAELGAVVSKGETIATLGSSGRSTGPHLHLEVRERGKALDPRYYVR